VKRTAAIALLLLTALTWALGLGLVAWGVVLGLLAFALLLYAGRPTPAVFGGLALTAALSFAIVAGILAHLASLSVLDMLVADGHWVGSAMAVLALAFASLGVASLVRAALSAGRSAPSN
jgi:hypothetical protein